MTIILEKIINQFSYQSKEFKYYREPDFSVIKSANKIVDEKTHFVQCSANSYAYSDEEKTNKYILAVEDNITYTGFKFVSCQCIYYNKWLNCKHTIALATELNLKLKGYELKEQLPSNQARGRTAKALVKEKEIVDKPPPAVRPYRKKN